mmetsp:Transcript_149072/g.259980  ORF Transcript_149072/g.259980 Transcript_149072/m.259980 type:complete len:230 (+) Transcript_149072:98-787(+)
MWTLLCWICNTCCCCGRRRKEEELPLPRAGNRHPSGNAHLIAPTKSERERSEKKRLKTFKVDDYGALDMEVDRTQSEIAEEEMEAMLRQELFDLKKIAKRLEGHVQKYPKTGKGLFKRMQDRYIAIQPLENTSSEPRAELICWKAGTLSYWESAQARKQGLAPKGDIPLLRIAKVDISKDEMSGRSVTIRHKMEHQMMELVLQFPTKRDAEEWSYGLWEFISKVRGRSN